MSWIWDHPYMPQGAHWQSWVAVGVLCIHVHVAWSGLHFHRVSSRQQLSMHRYIQLCFGVRGFRQQSVDSIGVPGVYVRVA